MGRLGSRVCRLADGGGGMGTVLHYVKEGGIVRGEGNVRGNMSEGGISMGNVLHQINYFRV